jgi:hypothetical protein
MNFAEKRNPPLNQVESINIVNILLPLVHFPLDPMPIQVSEEMVDVFGSGSISVPFSDVESEEGFVCVFLRLVYKFFKVGIEVCDEVLIEILAK